MAAAIRQTDSGMNFKVTESHGQADRTVSVIGSFAICISGHALQLFVAHITTTKALYSHTATWNKMLDKLGQHWTGEQTILNGASCETYFLT